MKKTLFSAVILAVITSSASAAVIFKDPGPIDATEGIVSDTFTPSSNFTLGSKWRLVFTVNVDGLVGDYPILVTLGSSPTTDCFTVWWNNEGQVGFGTKGLEGSSGTYTNGNYAMDMGNYHTFVIIASGVDKDYTTNLSLLIGGKSETYATAKITLTEEQANSLQFGHISYGGQQGTDNNITQASFISVNVVDGTVPEPTSASLSLLGLASLLLRRRRA